jgi:hypothetical protein
MVMAPSRLNAGGVALLIADHGSISGLSVSLQNATLQGNRGAHAADSAQTTGGHVSLRAHHFLQGVDTPLLLPICPKGRPCRWVTPDCALCRAGPGAAVDVSTDYLLTDSVVAVDNIWASGNLGGLAVQLTAGRSGISKCGITMSSVTLVDNLNSTRLGWTLGDQQRLDIADTCQSPCAELHNSHKKAAAAKRLCVVW